MKSYSVAWVFLQALWRYVLARSSPSMRQWVCVKHWEHGKGRLAPYQPSLPLVLWNDSVGIPVRITLEARSLQLQCFPGWSRRTSWSLKPSISCQSRRNIQGWNHWLPIKPVHIGTWTHGLRVSARGLHMVYPIDTAPHVAEYSDVNSAIQRSSVSMCGPVARSTDREKGRIYSTLSEIWGGHRRSQTRYGLPKEVIRS